MRDYLYGNEYDGMRGGCGVVTCSSVGWITKPVSLAFVLPAATAARRKRPRGAWLLHGKRLTNVVLSCQLGRC